MQSILTFEQLSVDFSEYVAIFFTLPNTSIPRPTKAKKLMDRTELSLHEGWNKHICKICSQTCAGGAGSGWTNLLNHLGHNHAIGGMRTSWRDFLIEKMNPSPGVSILNHFSFPVEIQTIHYFLNLVVTKNLPLQCCEWKELRKGFI